MTFFSRRVPIWYTLTRIIQKPIISHPHQDLGPPDPLVYLLITKQYLIIMLFYLSLTMRENFASFYLTLSHEEFFFCPVFGTFFYWLLDFYGCIDPKYYG